MAFGMPVRRGHIAPQNTYIDTLIRKFDGQQARFIIANAVKPNKPIIYCSDGFCELFGFTRGQLLIKSALLYILHGELTSRASIKALHNALCNDVESELNIRLYRKDGAKLELLKIL
ncbi:unnamed protein product [Protopolystoma xenopodis]|uniref:PAS domain-containing protein n=1 Tax=Protopolystoma xenopodis TaxID=117903 RepID=A0A3S4ZUQ1_9PLAT|nr:unnamed protein product [Protopolystoma xenopodis]